MSSSPPDSGSSDPDNNRSAAPPVSANGAESAPISSMYKDQWDRSTYVKPLSWEELEEQRDKARDARVSLL